MGHEEKSYNRTSLKKKNLSQWTWVNLSKLLAFTIFQNRQLIQRYSPKNTEGRQSDTMESNTFLIHSNSYEETHQKETHRVTITSSQNQQEKSVKSETTTD